MTADIDSAPNDRGKDERHQEIEVDERNPVESVGIGEAADQRGEQSEHDAGNSAANGNGARMTIGFHRLVLRAAVVTCLLFSWPLAWPLCRGISNSPTACRLASSAHSISR